MGGVITEPRVRTNVVRRGFRAHLGASLAGLFAGLGALVVVGGLFAGFAAAAEFQLNLVDAAGEVLELSTLGSILALAAVFFTFLFGGWVAGRMSRYDGAINGLGAGLWLLFFAALFALIGAMVGAEFNVFAQAGLPDWFTALRSDFRSTTGVLFLVLFSAAVLGGGYLGGRLGAADHRADHRGGEEIVVRPVV
jgi:hypothetical protein